MRSLYAGRILILILSLSVGVACEEDREEEQLNTGTNTCSIPEEWGKEDRKKVERIREFFIQKHERGSFSGTVLIAEKGRVLHEASYGYRDRRRKKRALKVKDPLQLASTSKSLTSTLILKLWEKGALELEDTLSQFFQDWPYKGISIRMLLDHRSGLSNYMYFMEGETEGDYRNEEVLKKMKKDTPDPYYVPDHRYNYCNTNYCLLASIAEKVTDTNFRAAIREEIYRAVGMEWADSAFSKGPIAAKVKGHNEWGRPIKDYKNKVIGDKGLYASVRDLYRFDQALRKGDLLDDSTLQEAYRPQHQDLYAYDNYGLGWRIDQRNKDDRVVWHNGWWKGFRTYFIRLLERNATIIVLTNTARGRFLNKSELIELLYPDRKSPY